VQVLNPTIGAYVDARMGLDTGYEGDGLITSDTVRCILKMEEDMTPMDESVCVCLNGEELRAVGKVTLRWRGKIFSESV
jgi:hypothetical protein